MGAAFNPLIILLPLILCALVPVGVALGSLFFLCFLAALAAPFIHVLGEVARRTPFLRLIVPDDSADLDARSPSVSATKQKEQLQNEIDADILKIEGELSERDRRRQMLSASEARCRVDEAQDAVHSAEAAVAMVTLDVKRSGGGWMRVCEVRNKLRDAEERLFDAVADAKAIGALLPEHQGAMCLSSSTDIVVDANALEVKLPEPGLANSGSLSPRASCANVVVRDLGGKVFGWQDQQRAYCTWMKEQGARVVATGACPHQMSFTAGLQRAWPGIGSKVIRRLRG